MNEVEAEEVPRTRSLGEALDELHQQAEARGLCVTSVRVEAFPGKPWFITAELRRPYVPAREREGR